VVAGPQKACVRWFEERQKNAKSDFLSFIKTRPKPLDIAQQVWHNTKVADADGWTVWWTNLLNEGCSQDIRRTQCLNALLREKAIGFCVRLSLGDTKKSKHILLSTGSTLTIEKWKTAEQAVLYTTVSKYV
jgi:hypothetical protein